MRIKISLIILLGLIQSVPAQIGNDKDVIVENKVESSFEKHCFSGSNSSCTVIWEKYDRQGNSIEWNMGRLGTIYRNIYDKKNNKIFTLWVDKIDTTQIDSIPYVYDKNNQLIQDGENKYKNLFNHKNQLVKQLSESQNNEKNVARNTRTIDWTSFDKVKTEIIKTEIIKTDIIKTDIIETTKPTEYEKLKIYRKEYEYDNNNNLSKETHYKDDVVTNTIIYNYDSLHRLIEKREKNISRIKSINFIKSSNREDISELITKIAYYKNGAIKEKYTYFMDPCMSLDNHFLYKHFYKKNGLLEKADVYEEDKLTFTISYEYEYFE
ncbi:hypothetical protein [uncultured Aquimarina sp.]|uniref:hypothetical protein n=1 Tax=uncultured Aquimarina sp. TaxID=575652 RepID=UPI0026153EC3|nr:hypothetical protein [uncultured Aquimarina sp.]